MLLQLLEEEIGEKAMVLLVEGIGGFVERRRGEDDDVAANAQSFGFLVAVFDVDQRHAVALHAVEGGVEDDGHRFQWHAGKPGAEGVNPQALA